MLLMLMMMTTMLYILFRSSIDHTPDYLSIQVLEALVRSSNPPSVLCHLLHAYIYSEEQLCFLY